LDEVGESALVQAVGFLKTQGSAIIMTTHRPRLVSVVDNLLVLRNGQQVGFGPAEDMINAVRNLQVVEPSGPTTTAYPDDIQAEVIAKEATNDAPIYAVADPVDDANTGHSVQDEYITEAPSPIGDDASGSGHIKNYAGQAVEAPGDDSVDVLLDAIHGAEYPPTPTDSSGQSVASPESDPKIK
jgi:ABC-type multidrug transport system ATPase subunit